MIPNIYVMYVGGAGNGKSVAFDKVEKVLSTIEKIPRSANIETVQSMIDYMVGSGKGDEAKASPVLFMGKWPTGQTAPITAMTIMADEFINFISLDEAKWINMLNEVYNYKKSYTYRTMSMGEKTIIGPYFVMLANLTTECASDMQKAKVLNTGLARRTIFQFGERQWNKPVARPIQTEAQEKAFARCVEHLKLLRTVDGEFTWSEEATAWWDPWYAKNLADVPKQAPTVQSWFASKSMQLLKLGMLTALSEYPPTLVLQVHHFTEPLAYLAEMEKDLYRIFGGTGQNILASTAIAILEYIRDSEEPVLEKALRAKFWQSIGGQDPMKGFAHIIQHLIESGQVVSHPMTFRSVACVFLAKDQETMTAFLSRVAAAQQSVGVQPVAVPGQVNPSTAPGPQPAGPASVAPRVSSPPFGGTGAVPPPTL